MNKIRIIYKRIKELLKDKELLKSYSINDIINENEETISYNKDVEDIKDIKDKDIKDLFMNKKYLV